MSEVFKILGVAILTAIAVILLKGTKPELAFAVTLTGVILILFFIVKSMRSVLSIFQTIVDMAGIDNGLVKLLLKIVGIGYVTEFGAGLLSDFGSTTIADKVVLGGKITVVILSLPILQGLLQLIGEFLRLT